MPGPEGGRAPGSHTVLLGQVIGNISYVSITSVNKFVPSSTYTVPTTRETELSPQLVGIGSSEPRGHGNHTR